VRRRVAVVFGGRSAEHEISLLSARSVIDALDADRYEVLAIGVTKDGRWELLPSGPPTLPADAPPDALAGVSPGSGTEIALDQEPGSQALVAADGSRTRIDVVFPVLHGPYGEDGSIQGFLEMAGVPYVGAGVLASAVGMDKAVQKVLFAAAGIPGVPYEVVHERDWAEDPEAVEARASHLGYPLFAKPAGLGSSIGIERVDDPSRLRGALETTFRFGRKAVLERAATGARELEVSVLATMTRWPRSRGEIVPRGHAFYDFEAKYLDEQGAELVIPADIAPGTLEELQQAGGGRIPGDRRRRDGAGRLLPDAGRPGVPERGEHDPRVHRHLDVPAAVGGVRVALPRARRPADRARDRAPRIRTQAGYGGLTQRGR
jgi:D-alanine-D-alanine ligase